MLEDMTTRPIRDLGTKGLHYGGRGPPGALRRAAGAVVPLAVAGAGLALAGYVAGLIP